MQAGLCGAGAALLLLGAPGQAEAGEIYYVDWGTTKDVFTDDTIRTINKNGTGAQTLLNIERPIGLALDAVNNRLFYASGGAGAVGRVGVINLTTLQDTTLVSGANIGTDNDAQDIKLDLANGKMYWSSYHQGLRRANLDGSNVEVIQAGNVTADTRGGVAIGNNTLYYGSPSSGNMYSSPLTNPAAANDMGWDAGANSLSINPDGSRIFWGAGGSILSNTIAGDAPQTLASGLIGAFLGTAISSDGSTVYWSERHAEGVGGRIAWDDTDPNTPANVQSITTGMGFGIAVAPVPEPGTVTLLAAAGGALLVRRRRTEG
jgi:hypothetical protein